MSHKKFVDFCIGAFTLIGVAFLTVPKNWMPAFYYPEFMAFASFLSAGVIYLPKIIFKNPEPQKQRAVTRIQAVIAFGLLLNGVGGLGLFQLYKVGIEFDKIVHLIVPFLFTVESVRLFMSYFEFSFKKALLLIVLIVIFSSFIGEFIEFFFDAIFKSKTFGLGGTRVTEDTIMDLVMDFTGIILGVISLIYMNKKKALTTNLNK